MILKRLFAHISIILSGMIIVLLCIDRVNKAMAFINNNITKGLLGILCVISIVNAIQLLRRKKKKAKHL